MRNLHVRIRAGARVKNATPTKIIPHDPISPLQAQHYFPERRPTRFLRGVTGCQRVLAMANPFGSDTIDYGTVSGQSKGFRNGKVPYLHEMT